MFVCPIITQEFAQIFIGEFGRTTECQLRLFLRFPNNYREISDLFRDMSSSGLIEKKKNGKNKCLGSIKFDAENFQINFFLIPLTVQIFDLKAIDLCLRESAYYCGSGS